jgi:hypothetical protein
MAIAIIGSIVGSRTDLAIALFINFLVFWILTFLIPGVLSTAKYKMSEKSKWWYMIAPLTTFCMLIYMILVIFLSGNNFWNYYTQYILIAIGISILLSLILICYAHEM